MTKAEIREIFNAKRLALSPKELETISESVCHLLFSHHRFEGKKMSMFLPIERKKEINTYKIWEKAKEFGAQIAIPKANFKTNEMKQVIFDSEEQLEVSSFGIPEPKRGRVIAAEHFDVVLVPLLAFDKKGNRVGYGKGFYDRFLKKCSPRCRFIGLSHFDEVLDTITDTEFHDIKLHEVITPNRIIRF